MSYNDIRQQYRPRKIKYLLIAESPPPKPSVQSSRQFYYTDRVRKDDRLFTNTVKALYPQTSSLSEPEIQQQKAAWLKRFADDGFYMIEALEESQAHEVTKKQRQDLIKASLPKLLKRVGELAGPQTKIILIKSNVFEAAAEPLRQAGFKVLNTKLLDYPGQFNQKTYRDGLSTMVSL